MASKSTIKDSAIRTIEIELNALSDLGDRIDGQFIQACQSILDSHGRVVVLGIGKSGHIGKKIAATLASTGTPSLFVHPAEASHGDIGMITGQDIVLAISNSGNTDEITSLLPVLKRKNVLVIAMTGNPESPLAKAADVQIDASVSEEACPLGLAPTSSTTVTLVLGDAIAMALLEARGFTRDDFAFSHPGGSLGRQLLIKVSDLMHKGEEIPKVEESTSLSEALIEMSSKGFGLTTVINENGEITGVFTDGDLRRSLDRGIDIQSTNIEQVMSEDYKHIAEGALAVEAAKLMQQSSVYVVIVKNESNQLAGILKMHDLLQANVI